MSGIFSTWKIRGFETLETETWQMRVVLPLYRLTSSPEAVILVSSLFVREAFPHLRALFEVCRAVLTFPAKDPRDGGIGCFGYPRS